MRGARAETPLAFLTWGSAVSAYKERFEREARAAEARALSHPNMRAFWLERAAMHRAVGAGYDSMSAADQQWHDGASTAVAKLDALPEGHPLKSGAVACGCDPETKACSCERYVRKVDARTEDRTYPADHERAIAQARDEALRAATEAERQAMIERRRQMANKPLGSER